MKEQHTELQKTLYVVFRAGIESLTFHQDNKNIPHDGEGGAQDKYGEQEGADGVSHLIFWLKETNNTEN